MLMEFLVLYKYLHMKQTDYTLHQVRVGSYLAMMAYLCTNGGHCHQGE